VKTAGPVFAGGTDTSDGGRTDAAGRTDAEGSDTAIEAGSTRGVGPGTGGAAAAERERRSDVAPAADSAARTTAAATKTQRPDRLCISIRVLSVSCIGAPRTSNAGGGEDLSGGIDL
jgi:hypothetical protein